MCPAGTGGTGAGDGAGGDGGEAYHQVCVATGGKGARSSARAAIVFEAAVKGQEQQRSKKDDPLCVTKLTTTLLRAESGRGH